MVVVGNLIYRDSIFRSVSSSREGGRQAGWDGWRFGFLFLCPSHSQTPAVCLCVCVSVSPLPSSSVPVAVCLVLAISCTPWTRRVLWTRFISLLKPIRFFPRLTHPNSGFPAPFSSLKRLRRNWRFATRLRPKRTALSLLTPTLSSVTGWALWLDSCLFYSLFFSPLFNTNSLFLLGWADLSWIKWYGLLSSLVRAFASQPLHCLICLYSWGVWRRLVYELHFSSSSVFFSNWMLTSCSHVTRCFPLPLQEHDLDGL